MATATVAEFLEKLPEFGVTESGGSRTYSDTYIKSALNEALQFYNRRKNGIIYVAAHLIVLDKAERPGPGPATLDVGLQSNVTSERVGPLAVTYRSEMRENRTDFFSRSVYGRYFLELEKHSAYTAMAVRSY